MSTATHRANNGFHFMFVAGIVVVAIAIAWWLVYYAQAGGVFHELGAKTICLVGYTDTCSTLRGTMEASNIPTYLPWRLWLGVAEIVFGVFLTRRADAAVSAH